MPERHLTVDLGNTSCSLLVWEHRDAAGTAVRRLGWDRESDSLGRLADELGELGPIARAAISSVADEARTNALIDLLRACAGEVAGAPDPGLRLEVESPETVGADRLFAARGAAALVRGTRVVVDAGTALTVDAVTPSGAFLGGAIAPGPSLLARALAAGGARLPEFEPAPGAPALGRDTPRALAAGVSVGFRGAARALVLEIAADPRVVEHTRGTPTIVLTGGARSFLLEPTPFVPLVLHEVPDLVHRGLLVALP